MPRATVLNVITKELHAMRKAHLTACLSAALCVALVGAGCSTKGVQATAEDELMRAGEVERAGGATGGGRGRGEGLGRSGMSEQDLAGGAGGMGSGQIEESDLGSGGFGDGETFGSGGSPGFGGGPGGSRPGMGGEPGTGGAGAFGGPGGFDPSMGAEGEGGGLGAFPDIGGTGSPGFSDQGFGGFESVEPGQLPAEDRVGEDTMIAKAEPSDAFESQVEGMQDERLGDAAGKLEDIFFGYDSWRISEDAKVSLGESAEWLKANPDAALTVEGHCDERGSSSYNLVLGEKRAKAVRNYLVELGVSPGRVKVVSYGEERPFCEEATESCYQLNRRGHLDAR